MASEEATGGRQQQHHHLLQWEEEADEESVQQRVAASPPSLYQLASVYVMREAPSNAWSKVFFSPSANHRLVEPEELHLPPPDPKDMPSEDEEQAEPAEPRKQAIKEGVEKALSGMQHLSREALLSGLLESCAKSRAKANARYRANQARFDKRWRQIMSSSHM